jgi:phosphatidylserine/phosphatidylglycerophosphate/cardiolipin synthase-like enzyme
MIEHKNIKIHFGPTELNQPDSLEDVIISFIDGAKEELNIAVQELDNENIAKAIIRARQRKVFVRLVLEFGYLTVTEALPDPWAVLTGSEGNEVNRRIYNAMLRAQVDVRTDINPSIFHQKFVIRDPDRPDAAVLTGSANFTDTDCHKNLNHIVILKSKRAADIYGYEFKELIEGNFGLYRSRSYPAPKDFDVSGVRIRILFAPDHSPEMEIMKQMLKAKQQIDFAIFTFSQSSGIDDTMIVLQRSGINIRGIFDKGQGNQDWASTRILKTGNADVYLAGKNPALRKLHHKLMVIDKETIIAGSFNYTDPANTLNDENIIVIGDSFETNPDSIAAQKKLGLGTHNMIDKMITDFGVQVV